MDTRKRRREQGLCPTCGAKPNNGHVQCSECSEKRRREDKERRSWRESKGLCTRCGKNYIYDNYKTCEFCRAAGAERQIQKYHSSEDEKEARRRMNRANHKRLRERRKENGICVICGRKAQVGRLKCSVCLHKDAIRHRVEYTPNSLQYKKDHGLCIWCGSDDVEYGKQRCRSCIDKQRAQLADARSKIKNQVKIVF